MNEIEKIEMIYQFCNLQYDETRKVRSKFTNKEYCNSIKGMETAYQIVADFIYNNFLRKVIPNER